MDPDPTKTPRFDWIRISYPDYKPAKVRYIITIRFEYSEPDPFFFKGRIRIRIQVKFNSIQTRRPTLIYSDNISIILTFILIEKSLPDPQF